MSSLRQRPDLRRWRRVLLALALAALAGCAAKVPQGKVAVRKISFEENKRYFRFYRGTADYNLRTAMEQTSSPVTARFFPWIERSYLDPELLAGDAWRLEIWYAHNGFFDARFIGWEVETVRPANRRRGEVVKIVGHVDEGDESMIASVRFEGLETVGRAIRLRLNRVAPAQPDERFSLSAYKATEEMILQVLRENSFARATVVGRVEARPGDREVELIYEIEPGPSCTFGDVRLSGLESVPDDVIWDEIEIVPGQSYSTRAIAQTQQEIFALGAFALVQVIPDLSAEGTVIPVQIQITEATFRQARIGAGFGWQNGQQFVRSTASFSHSNLAQRLLRLQLEGWLGYKSFADFASITDDETATDESAVDEIQASLENNAGGIGGASLELTWPRVLDLPRWSYHQGFSAELDREQGYAYGKASVVPAFSYQARDAYMDRATLTQSLHLEVWSLEAGTELDATPQGFDLENYLLAFLEQQLIHDRRDDELYPRRGYLILGSVREAMLIQSKFPFLRWELDMRRYMNLKRPRSVVATRLMGGQVLPLGDATGSYFPFSQRFYLGGANDVRGWGRNYIGPRACAEPVDPARADGENIYASEEECIDAGEFYALGGRASAAASAEWRIDGRWDTVGVIFADAGMLWDINDTLPPIWITVGLGARYKSPVGPIRLDLGYRLAGIRFNARDGQRYPNDTKYGFHFALSEAF